jgi:PPP family 3-phenylpropionic acid transporter
MVARLLTRTKNSSRLGTVARFTELHVIDVAAARGLEHQLVLAAVERTHAAIVFDPDAVAMTRYDLGAIRLTLYGRLRLRSGDPTAVVGYDRCQTGRKTAPLTGEAQRPMAEPNERSRTASDLIRFVLMFSALYVAFGVASPFLPVFLSSRGVTSEQIGFLLSVGAVVRLVSGPIAGRIADRLHARRVILSICTFGAAVITFAFVPASAFSLLLVISFCQAAMLAPTTILADALAVRTASRKDTSEAGFEYGWVRGAGSAAFIVGSLGSGQMLDAFPPAAAMITQGLLLLIAAGTALLVPEIAARSRVSLSATSGLPGLPILISNRPFRRLVLVAALILGSHAMHDSFAMIAWNAAGITPSMSSVLWSESVAAEVVIFLVLGPWLLGKVTPTTAMGISAVAATLRWAMMAQSPSVLALAFLEPLHGLTFALLHLACMRVLVRVTTANLAATAQAIYALGIGISSALLTFASGFLYAELGLSGFAAMSLLAAVSLPVVGALSRALTTPSDVQQSR